MTYNEFCLKYPDVVCGIVEELYNCEYISCNKQDVEKIIESGKTPKISIKIYSSLILAIKDSENIEGYKYEDIVSDYNSIIERKKEILPVLENESTTIQYQMEEFERCKNDPVYFYNTYTNTGKTKPITQEEWDSVINDLTFKRRR
jgi:hypothetical protein